MGDYDVAILNTVSEISKKLLFMDSWLYDAARGGLDEADDDIFDMLESARSMLASLIESVEDTILTRMDNVDAEVHGVGLQVEGLNTYLQQEIQPTLNDVKTTVEANAEQLSYLSKLAEEIPDKTAALINQHVDQLMGEVGSSIDLFRQTFEVLIQSQTNKIIETMTANNAALTASIQAQGQLQASQIETMGERISQSVSDGFSSQNTVLSGIRETIETELRNISERQVEFQDVLILFFSEFWLNLASWWSGQNKIDSDAVEQGIRDSTELSTVVLGQTVTEPTPQPEDQSDIVAWLEKQAEG